MEMISVNKSSVLKLCLLTKVDGYIHTPALIDIVRTRFNFEQIPDKSDDLNRGIEFLNGAIDGVTVEKLGLYSDGVILESRSPTKSLDLAFAELTAWAETDLGLKMIETHNISKLYESDITVHSDGNIVNLGRRIEKICKLLSAGLMKISNIDADPTSVGFSISPDINKLPGLKPSAFRVDRQAGADFARNLFRSGAPLTTDLHLELLQELETLSLSREHI